MKKSIKVIISIFVILGLLTACGGGNSGGKTAKIGVASSQKVIETNDADEIEFDIIVAGVALVDDKISFVNIDFSEQFAKKVDGKITAEAMLTKKQKGDDYGLKSTSETTGLGKEWMEQIAGVEEGLIGKTVVEAKEYFAGEDILSAATIGLTEIEMTVIKAIDTAVEVSNVSKVGLGYDVLVSTTNDDTKVTSVLEYALVAVDSDGNIVKALLDTAEEKAELNDDKWNLVNVNKTKSELKDDYGLIVASELGIEWYKQNESLMTYLEGKTLDDVANLNDNPSEDEDLKTSVSIGLSGVKAAIAYAANNLVSID